MLEASVILYKNLIISENVRPSEGGTLLRGGWRKFDHYNLEKVPFLFHFKMVPFLGLFLANDLQTPPLPSKRADGKIFLAYFSDDFKTKKEFVKNFFFNV